jgi:hypothetical protein
VRAEKYTAYGERSKALYQEFSDLTRHLSGVYVNSTSDSTVDLKLSGISAEKARAVIFLLKGEAQS